MEYRGYEIEDNVMLPRGVRLDELCDDLANYADYSASDVKIKDIGYDYDWLELTLPIEINPDLFEAYLEGIKAHYEE